MADLVLPPEVNPQPMPPAPADGRCPKATLWKASCKSRSCPVCGPRWGKNAHEVLATALGWARVRVATLAITAPGADVLPWDDGYCARRRAAGARHVHSGRRGCRCEQRPLREWCETLPWRWKKLREAARLATKRGSKCGVACGDEWVEGVRGFTGTAKTFWCSPACERARGHVRGPGAWWCTADCKAKGKHVDVEAPPWVMCRVWEPQKRGAPHVHLVAPYGEENERRQADAFRSQLERLSPAYGFGRVQKKLKAIEGREAARYLADYLAGRNGHAKRQKKTTIRENIADPRLPRSLVWLTPVLTSVSESPRMVAMREARGVKLGTGVTMRTLRRARHLWAVAQGFFSEHPHWAGLEEAVVSVIAFRRVYPKRAGPPANEEQALAWARSFDREQNRRGGYLKAIWDYSRHEYVSNQPLFRELTELAFLATRGTPLPAGTV